MSENLPDWRPPLWVGEEGMRVRNTFVENGYGDTIKTVDALRSVDTYALGKIAFELYGTSKGTVRQYAANLPPGIEPDSDTARIPTELKGIVNDNVDSFDLITYHWHGPAYSSASEYNTRLEEVTELEGYRSAILGDSIMMFASEVEEAAEGAEETILGAANLLWAEVGLGVSVVTGGVGGILISTAGLIGAIAQKAQGAAERHQAEVEGATAATIDITTKDGRQAARGIEPEDLMPEFPEGTKGWEVE